MHLRGMYDDRRNRIMVKRGKKKANAGVNTVAIKVARMTERRRYPFSGPTNTGEGSTGS